MITQMGRSTVGSPGEEEECKTIKRSPKKSTSGLMCSIFESGLIHSHLFFCDEVLAPGNFAETSLPDIFQYNKACAKEQLTRICIQVLSGGTL